MQRLVLEIACSLVVDTASLTVEIVGERDTRTVKVQADAEGFGRLIGNQGRTVRAIRTILGASAMKMDRLYSLDIQKTCGSANQD